MARLYLSPGESTDAPTSQTDVFGVNGSNETVTLAANSKTNFDPSFNKGGDVIHILGNANLYTASLVGSSLRLTAANGANIVIPIGEVGTTITFADVAAGRTLYYDAALDKVCLGDQVLEGPAEAVVAGSGGGGGGGGSTGGIINLTVSHDDLTGTANNDTFRARVVQNNNGEQTNQLGTGDMLNGGAGDEDKLLATVQDASPLNDGPSSSIRPETVDVETAHFIALEVYNNEVLGQTYGESYMEDFHYLGVEINAAEMLGLDEVGSVGSDSTLTIYNLTTLKDDGVYANRRQTGDICVRMDHTGNGDAVTMAADLIVLFDQDYIIRPGDVKSGSRLNIEIMDMDAAISGRDPLEDNPFGQIEFTADGVTKVLNFGTTPNTYAELETAIRAAITAAAATDAFFSHLTVTRAVNSFKATDTDNDPVAGGFAFGDTITITNSGPETLLAVTMRATGTAPAGKDFHTNFNATKVNVEEQKTEVCVILNKVGRAGDGGDLIIGGMDTDGRNILGGGDSIEPGIQWFKVTVEGDETQDSSLASMKSTNNWLCKVTVESAAGSKAALTIGNNETSYEYNGISDYSSLDVTDIRNNALKDVLIFDASKFNNGAEVHGFFSTEAVAKYMNLTDIGASGADNANAVYSFGSGNDLLNMNLNDENMAVIGTPTREDFSFTANMGAGDDHVQIQIQSGFNAMYVGNSTSSLGFGSYDIGPNGQTAENWYYNHVLNQNLIINTAEGNDTVETWGASAAQINLGTGNDVAYTDNSGETGNFNEGHATWVFNSLNPELTTTATGPNVNNLQSQTQAAIFKAANLQLVVTFQDLVSKVNVGATVGSLTGETVTDLTINQAIKAAINTDPVLNKLLIAEDGPSRTLVVRSLIDGEHIATDLTVNLVSSGALTLAQVAGGALSLTQLDGTAGRSNLNSIGFDFATGNPLAGPATPAPNPGGFGRYDSEFGWDNTGPMLTGYDSINVNNNVVDGGLVATGSTDNDVIVLSSNGIGQGIGTSSITFGSSVETIDINGVFGRDTILNFTAAGDGQYRYNTNLPGVGVDPRLGIDGYDIFDLTTVIGTSVQFVDNVTNTADNGEQVVINGLVANNAWVGLTDIVESGDPGTTAASTTELARVLEIAKAADAAATTKVTTSVLITVDDTTNVGTFYKIVNGLAVGDVAVTELGKVELAQYDHGSKLPIGEWDMMTLTNFTPLAPPVLVTTFDQVG